MKTWMVILADLHTNTIDVHLVRADSDSEAARSKMGFCPSSSPVLSPSLERLEQHALDTGRILYVKSLLDLLKITEKSCQSPQ